uniref:Uncharacterized protein n=1 Tax=Trichobilharzia regenti TaxID=157069 RepID=A0AA85K4S8_TRIRE|nr:unnamed protein product [Trichobilharzia regenti]
MNTSGLGVLVNYLLANSVRDRDQLNPDAHVNRIFGLVEKCKLLDPKSVAFRDDHEYFTFLSGFINQLSPCYSFLISHRDSVMVNYGKSDVIGEEPNSPVSQLFAAQCWLCSVLKYSFSQVEFLKPTFVAHTSKELIKLAQLADELSASFSLPLWKFASGIMKQYKCEIRTYVHDSSRTKTNSANKEVDGLFSTILKCIVHSLLHYYDKCNRLYGGEVKPKNNSEKSENSIQMLNLLSRVFTFCIREFTKEVLTADRDPQAKVVFLDWLSWMIKVSYQGGSYPLGSSFDTKVAEELSSSFFLSVDIVLSHLISLHPSYESREDCSIFIQVLSRVDFDAPVICRIYGKILGNMSRHPNCYSRWMNDKFNIYRELFAACEKIDLSSPVKNNETKNREYPYSGEFYITILQQICASVCGLSMACFPYLETALLQSILSEHQLVHLLAMDVWCFVARYGTGDLCLQYVTLLTSVINKVARKLQSNDYVNDVKSITLMHTISRLSHLLSRLIVFLTPKQQSAYLNQNSLKYINIHSTADPISSLSNSLVWYYTPTPISRLQKVSCSIIQQQVTERLFHLDNNLIDINDASTINSLQITNLLTEVCLGLRLIDCLSDSQKRSISRTAVKCIAFLLKCHQIGTSFEMTNYPFAYSLSLKSWSLQPISTLFVCLSSWFPKLCLNSLNDPNSRNDTEVMNHLVRLSFNWDSTPSVQQLCSLSILHAWNSWFSLPVTQGYVKPWYQELKVNIDQLESSARQDSFTVDLLKSLQKKLDSVGLSKSMLPTSYSNTQMSPDSFLDSTHNVDDEVSRCLRDMSSVVNRLKSVWPPKGPNKSVQFNEARNILKHLSDFVYTS